MLTFQSYDVVIVLIFEPADATIFIFILIFPEIDKVFSKKLFNIKLLHLIFISILVLDVLNVLPYVVCSNTNATNLEYIEDY